ncbi:hypothetical protein L1887_61049 [Cichorium endivia]|nr:hypothetical protein L1887_61049 [Cichorium endivia]
MVVEEDEDEQSEESPVVKAPQARFPPRRTFISGSPKSRSASARSNTKSSAHHLCLMPMPSRPFSGATASASTWRYVPSGARSPFSGEWQAGISGTRPQSCEGESEAKATMLVDPCWFEADGMRERGMAEAGC